LQAGADEEARMKLTRMSKGCWDGSCPTIYATDRGTIVVQGYAVTDADVIPLDGEVMAEIPMELFRQVFGESDG